MTKFSVFNTLLSVSLFIISLMNFNSAIAAPKGCDDHDFKIHYWSNDIRALIKSRKYLGRFERKTPKTYIPSGFVHRKGVVIETRLREVKSLKACKRLIRSCDPKRDRRKPNWHLYCIQIKGDKQIGRLHLVK